MKNMKMTSNANLHLINLLKYLKYRDASLNQLNAASLARKRYVYPPSPKRDGRHEELHVGTQRMRSDIPTAAGAPWFGTTAVRSD
jgi:hypothetical protein